MQRSRTTKTADQHADDLEAHAKELMKIASDMRSKKTARGRQAKTGRAKKK